MISLLDISAIKWWPCDAPTSPQAIEYFLFHPEIKNKKSN